MRKCHAYGVPASVIAPVEQLAEGVQFNWAYFLCEKFLMNFREAQEKGKTLYYAWLLLTILLVVGELLKGNQFLDIEKNLPEAVQYNSLQAMKEATRIHEIKVFWIFMEEI